MTSNNEKYPANSCLAWPLMTLILYDKLAKRYSVIDDVNIKKHKVKRSLELEI